MPLRLAGKGPELEKCKNLATKLSAKNIEFLGFVGDEELPKLYAGARAFLFPVEEDFGLAPIEAMAAGTPVIYFNRGGACESVWEWGIPFEEQASPSLQGAIEKFLIQEPAFDHEKIAAHAGEFDEKIFREKLLSFLSSRT